HLAAHDVDELRQFVDRPGADEAPDTGEAWIIGARLCHSPAAFGDGHRAELPDEEGLSVEAAPLLPVEDRPRAVELDEQGYQQEERRQQEQAEQGAGKVEEALEQYRSVAQRLAQEAYRVVDAERHHIEEFEAGIVRRGGAGDAYREAFEIVTQPLDLVDVAERADQHDVGGAARDPTLRDIGDSRLVEPAVRAACLFEIVRAGKPVAGAPKRTVEEEADGVPAIADDTCLAILQPPCPDIGTGDRMGGGAAADQQRHTDEISGEHRNARQLVGEVGKECCQQRDREGARPSERAVGDHGLLLPTVLEQLACRLDREAAIDESGDASVGPVETPANIGKGGVSEDDMIEECRKQNGNERQRPFADPERETKQASVGRPADGAPALQPYRQSELFLCHAACPQVPTVQVARRDSTRRARPPITG